MTNNETEFDLDIEDPGQGEGEEATPDCSKEFWNEEALANETTFDNENGSIYLVGGNECSAKLKEAFKRRRRRMRRKVKEFVQKRRDLFPDVDPEDLPGEDEDDDTTEARLLQEDDEEKSGRKGNGGRRAGKKLFDKINEATAADKDFTRKDIRRFKRFEKYAEEIDAYTDGYAMMASWVWDAGNLSKDDVAGLCVADPADAANKASCWTLARKGNVGRRVEYNSFNIDPSLLDADIDMVALLNTEGDSSDDLFPGFFGSWQCGKLDKRKRADGKRVRANCRRFLPSVESSTATDYRFVKGPVTVYTYLSSRDAGDDSDDTLRLLSTDGEAMEPTSAMGPLEVFQVDLSGSIANLAFTGLSLGLSMLALGA